MHIKFFKYQGTGNDFIMVDNREGVFPKHNHEWVASLCHRRTGIGADGLILLEDHGQLDFEMTYYNADGNLGSMCGNGGRCIVAFAKFLGIIVDRASFQASDGNHSATIDEQNTVRLQMQDVDLLKQKPNYTFLDTGSPHHVQLVEGLQDLDVQTEGAKLRYGLYGKKGSNINFVEANGSNGFNVRTYERGVEDETLSCGTGVTAVALAMHKLQLTDANTINLHALGGNLKVEFQPEGEGYKKVYLIGPAKQVFKGDVEWNG